MRRLVLAGILVCAAAAAVAPVASLAQDKTPKVAILNIQAAIAQCKEGQQAAEQLRVKFAPRRDELEKMQAEINKLQDQLKNQQTTLSDDARNRLLRSVDDKTKSFNRANEDATADFQQAEQDAINEIGRKMMAVINEHAKKNSLSLVLDVSSPQTPVLFADQALDITEAVIQQYDAAHQASAAPPAAAAPAAKPAAAAPRPAAAPAAAPAQPKPAAAPKP